MKIEIIFEISTIENPKIDISLDFLWYTPSGLLSPPRGRPWGGWGYPKMKIEIIFEILTIETPELTQHLIFIGIPPLAPQAPTPLLGETLQGLVVP